MPGTFGPLAVELKDLFTGSAGMVSAPAFGGRATIELIPPRAPLGLLPQPVDKALATMAAQHNAKHGDPAKQADTRALRAVYRRGTRSFNKRRNPNMTARQWGMRRVRRHLNALAGGGAKLDRDLLPKKHPDHQASEVGRKALLVIEGGRGLPTAFELKTTVVLNPAMAAYRRHVGHGGIWDPQKHPRALHGRFGKALQELADELSSRARDDVSKGVDAHAAGVLSEAAGHVAEAAKKSKRLNPEGVRGALADASTVLREGADSPDASMRGARSLTAAAVKVGEMHREYRAAHLAGWVPRERKSLAYAMDPALVEVETKAGLSKWEPDKHPRDKNGRFVHIGAEVEAVVDGKTIRGGVIGLTDSAKPNTRDSRIASMNKGSKVVIRDAKGGEHVVDAKSTEVVGEVSKRISLREHLRGHDAADKNVRRIDSELKDRSDEQRRRGVTQVGAPGQTARADAEAAQLRADRDHWKGVRSNLETTARDRVSKGETIHDPPPGPQSDHDLSTRQGLIDHLHTHPAAEGFEPGAASHADLARMHDAAHSLGVHTHTHDGPTPRERGGAAPIADRPGAPELGDTRPDGQPWGSGYERGDPRNDPNYDRYVADLDARLTHAVEEHGDTATLFEDPAHPGTGIPRPDRRALHEQILGQLMANYESVPRERKALFMAGLPGAGKSTLIGQHGHEFGIDLDHDGNPDNFATVNPDDMKSLLLEHGGVPDEYAKYGFGRDEMASLLHEESSELAKKLQDRILAQGTNLLVDGTFGGKTDKQVGKVMAVRDHGYDVTGVLVDVPTELSLTRAGGRHTKGEQPVIGQPLRGRYVPAGVTAEQGAQSTVPSDILGREHYSHAGENFEAAGPAFNGGVHVYDASSGTPVKVYESGGAAPGVTTQSAPSPPGDGGRGPLPPVGELTSVTPRQMQAADAFLGEDGRELGNMTQGQALAMYRKAVRQGMPHGWHDDDPKA